MDYCFLRNGASEKSIVVVVAADRVSKAVCAHVVPHKGMETEWAADQLVKDLKKMSYYGRVILRSDNEPAITEFLAEVARIRAGATRRSGD